MRLVIVVLAASWAFGQTTRVFQLTQNENHQNLQEIAVLLHGIAGIEQMSTDDAMRTVTINGADGQVALADWLMHQVDLPANGPFLGVHEYRTAAGGDDVVRVFYLTRAPGPRDIQEIAVTIRTLADNPRLYVYNGLKAVVARGTSQQVAVAAWVADQLNQPAGAALPAPREFPYSGSEVARVFQLAHAETPEQLQEMTTLIRSVADMQRLFYCWNTKAMAMRGPKDRVDLAAWLINELDQPADAATATRGAAPEYRLPDDPQNLVRVFYLAGSLSDPERQRVFAKVRAATRIGRMYPYKARHALVARGTPEQMAIAQKVVEEAAATSVPHAGSTPAP